MWALIPKWAQHYGEFWRAIRVRNLWFIRLRYYAVIVLLGFLIAGEFLFDFNLSADQISVFLGISLLILIYNLIIHKTRNYIGCEPEKFNCLDMSLIQMMLDLVVLMVLVYYTGTIDSPLYMLFIFHMIIGSLILPGNMIYFVAALISAVFSSLVLLERFDILNKHIIQGLFAGERNHTLYHDIVFIVIFTFMLFFSVYIANKISRQLFKREQQLRLSLEKLNESEIAKQKYTIGIVHEIKTPINAVMSILELIHHNYVGPVSSIVDEKIIRAEARTQEALQLINDVLRISKLKLLEIKPNDDVDIKDFISVLIDNHDESFKEKKISILFEDKRSNPRHLKTDKILLELAISNVLTNSIKYVDENGRIELILGEKNNELFIEVVDNGIGIPEKEIHKIFDQFYRASNIDKAIHEGSGLGLSLVKEIVEKLGGTINVSSPSRIGNGSNPGTSFEIILPYHFKVSEYDIFEVNSGDYLSSKSDF